MIESGVVDHNVYCVICIYNPIHTTHSLPTESLKQLPVIHHNEILDRRNAQQE